MEIQCGKYRKSEKQVTKSGSTECIRTCSSSATIPISKSCVENELGVSNQISSIAIASFAALATMAGLPAGVMGVYISINTLCDMGATCVNVIGDMAGCVVLQEKIDLK